MGASATVGFSLEAIGFLKDLKANNSRAWFAANKPLYERAIKRPATDFCTAMTDQLQELTGLAHGSKIYRMHRDLRFAKDKTPYNAHLHIAFLPDCEMATPPGWFFGLDPDRLTLGTGLFAFDKPLLELYRQRVDSPAGRELAAGLAKLQADGARVSEAELKRVPQGYPPDHAQSDLLRRKGFAVWSDFDSRRAAEPDLPQTCF